MDETTDLKSYKIWNKATVFILIAAIVVLILSFLSPFIFTKEALNESFDFSDTGEIGDTIGGIMNPFIALVGVLLTFLAFYIQLRANQIQIKLFRDEKEIIKENYKKDLELKLKIIGLDISETIKDIDDKYISFKNYVKQTEAFPLSGESLAQTLSKAKNRIFNFDRVEVFQAFKEGFKKVGKSDDELIKHYNGLYRYIDYVIELEKSIYQAEKNNSKDLTDRINTIFYDVMELISNSIKLNISISNPKFDEIVNKLVTNFNIDTGEDLSEYKKIESNDLRTISNNSLSIFIEDIFEFTKTESKEFESDVTSLLSDIKKIRVSITKVENDSLIFAESIKNQIKNFDTKTEDSLGGRLKVILEIINEITDKK